MSSRLFLNQETSFLSNSISIKPTFFFFSFDFFQQVWLLPSTATGTILKAVSTKEKPAEANFAVEISHACVFTFHPCPSRLCFSRINVDAGVQPVIFPDSSRLTSRTFGGQRGSAVAPVPPRVSNRPVFAPRQPPPGFHLIVSGPVGRRAASRDGGRLEIKVAGTKQHAGD